MDYKEKVELLREDTEQEIDLVELYYALKKRIIIILAAVAAGAIIAFAVTKLFITPVYNATATMLVLTKETTLSSLADLQIGSQLTKDYSRLILSHSVLEQVIDNLGLDLSYGELESSITIDNPEDTRILDITVSNSDPKTAKNLAEEIGTVASAFIGDQMEVSPPKIIEEVELPTAPTSPNVAKNTLIGAIIGFIIAAGVIIFFSIIDDTIKSEDDIENYLGIPALASIPDRKDYINEKGTKKIASKKKRKRRKRA